jgi:hypothetical protein
MASADQASQFEPLAEIVAEGDLRAGLEQMATLLRSATYGARDPRLTRLRRELVEHKSALSRLERDSGGGRFSAEAILVERARLASALLDLVDELDRLARDGIAQFPAIPCAAVKPPINAAGDVAGGNILAEVDVFLSYARPDRPHIVELALQLGEQGCSVWFDHYIAGGARFHETINRHLDAAAAVIVLWSENSIRSDWVFYEADRAHKARKLVPIRHAGLPIEQVPPPYAAVLNVLVHGDHAALKQALNRFGLPRK